MTQQDIQILTEYYKFDFSTWNISAILIMKKRMDKEVEDNADLESKKPKGIGRFETSLSDVWERIENHTNLSWHEKRGKGAADHVRRCKEQYMSRLVDLRAGKQRSIAAPVMYAVHEPLVVVNGNIAIINQIDED